MNQLHDDAHKVLREAFELRAVSVRSAQAAGHTCYASLTECVGQAWYAHAAMLDEAIDYYGRKQAEVLPGCHTWTSAEVTINALTARKARVHAELVMLGFNV